MLAVWAIAFSLLAVVNAVPSGPNAILTTDTATPYVGQPVHFDASGSVGHDEGNGRIVAYAFVFGDGGTTGWQESPFAAHAYGKAGEYAAAVTVKDGRGLTGQASVSISVKAFPSPGTSPDVVPIGASVSPANPTEGDNVTVTVTLMNLGGATATNAAIQIIDVRPNGTQFALEPLSLPLPLEARATEAIISPAFPALGIGNHTLRITVYNVTPPEAVSGNNELNLTVTVGPAGSQDHGPAGFAVNPLVAGLIGAGIVSLAGALLLLLRPRPPGPMEPPPPSPPDRSPPPIWPP
ncbi:MAG: PKD domain-containing protein [Thermoplasmata archaeon]